MAQFSGKWRLVSSENSDAYLATVKAADQFVALIKSVSAELKTNPDVYVEDIQVDKAANTVHRVVYVRGAAIRDFGVVPFGKEVEIRCYGKPAKAFIQLESDTKIVRSETGDDFTATTTLVLNGDEITVTSTSGGVTSVEKFQRI